MSSDPFSVVPQPYRAVFEHFVQTTQQLLRAGKPLRQLAFVGKLGADEPLMLEMDTLSPDAKVLSARHVRETARMLQADFVFTVGEGWSLPESDLPRLDAILDRYGSLADCPQRIEVAFMVLETYDGVFSLSPRIKPYGASKRRRTFAEPMHVVVADSMQGRYAELLPPRSDGKTLH